MLSESAASSVQSLRALARWVWFIIEMLSCELNNIFIFTKTLLDYFSFFLIFIFLKNKTELPLESGKEKFLTQAKVWSPLSDPTCYCPTRLELPFCFDGPGSLISSLLWCVSQLLPKHYCIPVYIFNNYTFIFFFSKTKRQPFENFAATVMFPADDLVCQAMTVFTVKGCNKQTSVRWIIAFNTLK